MTLEQIAKKLDAIQASVSRQSSPWLRGDKEGAAYAGFLSVNSFKTWAKERGIKPDRSDGINFWSKADIDRAREKGKR